jgi:hypothetical protein
MPRKLSQLKAKPNVFVGEVNGVDAVWQRRKPKKAKRNEPGAQRMVLADQSGNSAP